MDIQTGFTLLMSSCDTNIYFTIYKLFQLTLYNVMLVEKLIVGIFEIEGLWMKKFTD